MIDSKKANRLSVRLRCHKLITIRLIVLETLSARGTIVVCCIKASSAIWADPSLPLATMDMFFTKADHFTAIDSLANLLF